MALPVSFEDVSYFKRTYGGDLIITDGVIYYFPNTNLADQTNKNLSGWNRMTLYGGLLFLVDDLAIILGTAWRSQMGATMNSPLIKEAGLWRDGDSSKALQDRLDAHLTELKEQIRRPEDYSTSLPPPMRFAREDISGLSLKFTGTLKFEAHFDNHDFFVNAKRKKLLRTALGEAGFLR